MYINGGNNIFFDMKREIDEMAANETQKMLKGCVTRRIYFTPQKVNKCCAPKQSPKSS
jgi:hypothetical protein